MEQNHARQACTGALGPFDLEEIPGAGCAGVHIRSDR